MFPFMPSTLQAPAQSRKFLERLRVVADAFQ
jgi:hypothetical protein